jgi:hypothetical protein
LPPGSLSAQMPRSRQLPRASRPQRFERLYHDTDRDIGKDRHPRSSVPSLPCRPAGGCIPGRRGGGRNPTAGVPGAESG